MEQELYKVTLLTKGSYANANKRWADLTGSTPVDKWNGPGTYVGDGWYADCACHIPVSALRRVA